MNLSSLRKISSLLSLTLMFATHAWAQNNSPSVVYSASSFQLFASQHVYLVPKISGLASGQNPNCVSNSLPPGLSVNQLNCVVSGVIPSFVPPGGVPFNSTVSSSFAPAVQLNFQLQAQGIQYSDTTFQLYANQQVSIFPKLVGIQPGQQLGCSASALPSGLQINSATCAITGQLPSQLPSQGFTINTVIFNSVSNSPISLTFQLSSQGIVFSASAYQLFAGQQVSIFPKLIGFQPSQAVNCSANALPPGLQMNPANCAITGMIPQMLPPQGFSFIVDVYSPVLQQPIQLSFQLTNQSILFPATSFTLNANQQVAIIPVLVGFQPSQPVNCSTNGLPPGLQIDPATCAITGQVPAYLPGPTPTTSTLVYSSALPQPIQLTFYLTPSTSKIVKRQR